MTNIALGSRICDVGKVLTAMAVMLVMGLHYAGMLEATLEGTSIPPATQPKGV